MKVMGNNTHRNYKLGIYPEIQFYKVDDNNFTKKGG